MATFNRTETKYAPNFERITPDMAVKAGAGKLEHLQLVAQSKVDGLIYPYVPEDANKGVIVGIYTGITKDVVEDEKVLITTNVTIAKDDIVGLDLEADFTAITQLRQVGVILVDKLMGTTEV